MGTILESWDLTVPDVPPRARFYPLEPIGIGTPWVESLTSYLLRLAEAHSVPVGAVTDELRRCAAKALPSPGLKMCGCLYRLLAYSVNGVEESAVKWVYMLGAATLRNELKHLTFSPLKTSVLPGLEWVTTIYSALRFRVFRTNCVRRTGPHDFALWGWEA